MWSLLIHLATVGIGITEHVACEFDNHHLHTEANTECGYIVRASVVSCHNFSLDTTLSEARAYHHAVETGELFGYVLLGEEL